MTEATLATGFYLTRQVLGIALGILAVWVGIGPELRALARRLRPPRPRSTESATTSPGATAPTTAESRAA